MNARNGGVKGTVTGTITPDDWLTASGGIARQLAAIICQPDDLYFRIVGPPDSGCPSPPPTC